MTKGEIINEISEILAEKENPNYALGYLTTMFSEYVNVPGNAMICSKAHLQARLDTIKLRYSIHG